MFLFDGERFQILFSKWYANEITNITDEEYVWLKESALYIYHLKDDTHKCVDEILDCIGNHGRKKIVKEYKMLSGIETKALYVFNYLWFICKLKKRQWSK